MDGMENNEVMTPAEEPEVNEPEMQEEEYEYEDLPTLDQPEEKQAAPTNDAAIEALRRDNQKLASRVDSLMELLKQSKQPEQQNEWDDEDDPQQAFMKRLATEHDNLKAKLDAMERERMAQAQQSQQEQFTSAIENTIGNLAKTLDSPEVEAFMSKYDVMAAMSEARKRGKDITIQDAVNQVYRSKVDRYGDRFALRKRAERKAPPIPQQQGHLPKLEPKLLDATAKLSDLEKIDTSEIDKIFGF